MVANQQVDSTAINNVFGENPYGEDNLETMLAQHGVQQEQLEAKEEVIEQAVMVKQPHINLNQKITPRASWYPHKNDRLESQICNMYYVIWFHHNALLSDYDCIQYV